LGFAPRLAPILKLDTIIPHSGGLFTITRRNFIIASGMTALASTRVFGANDTLRIGVIGAGQRMRGLLNAADKSSAPYQIVAISDVYGLNCDAIKERSHGLATTHLDYREMLDNKEIDAVIIASPDHWHVTMAVDALKAGKDVYLEKPVTHTMEEGDILTNAAVETGVAAARAGHLGNLAYHHGGQASAKS
jgi:GFO/IDH/MocA oxidoreductase family protein